MKQPYETIAKTKQYLTDEIDIERAYNIIDHYCSQPEDPKHSRAYAQIPYDGLQAVSESGLATHVTKTHVMEQPETIPLIIETCNALGWGSTQDWLLRTVSQIVLVQEHKLIGEALIENAKRWCDSKGWHGIFDSA